jgi:lipid A 3-O-deacylase
VSPQIFTIITICFFFGWLCPNHFSREARSVVASLLVISFAARGQAQDYLVGARGGISFENDACCFRQAEAFAGIDLPWQWNASFGLALKPRVEMSGGCLNYEDENGFVGTLGPVIELGYRKFPVTLEGGISPTFLSKYNFALRDLGGRFQFTDHIGLDWHITKNFTVGWRFQHMSNAGIYHHNPGLNLQMLSIGYNF